VLTPDLRATLAAHKVELLAHLREPVAAAQLTPPPDPAEVARVLGLPLDRLDRMVEVRVPWAPVRLWFVPTEAAVELLLAEGVPRGRIWTASELRDLLRIPGLTNAGARRVATAKMALGDGVLNLVRARLAIDGGLPDVNSKVATPAVERDARDVCAPRDGTDWLPGLERGPDG
jgi:hypothetical protein